MKKCAQLEKLSPAKLSTLKHIFILWILQFFWWGRCDVFLMCVCEPLVSFRYASYHIGAGFPFHHMTQQILLHLCWGKLMKYFGLRFVWALWSSDFWTFCCIFAESLKGFLTMQKWEKFSSFDFPCLKFSASHLMLRFHWRRVSFPFEWFCGDLLAHFVNDVYEVFLFPTNHFQLFTQIDVRKMFHSTLPNMNFVGK